jgi:hypothetical protein
MKKLFGNFLGVSLSGLATAWFVVSFLSTSAVAMGKAPHPADPAPSPSPLPSVEADSPYMKLETDFNQASAMPLSSIPTPADPQFANWRCARSIRSAPAVVVDHEVPTHLQGKIVVGAEVPGTPGEGPEFPGTPPQPEKDQIVDFIVFDWSNQPLPEDSDIDLGNLFTSEGGQLVTSPDLQMLWKAADSYVTVELRMKGQQIYFKESGKGDLDDYLNGDAYGYCWNQSNGPSSM